MSDHYKFKMRLPRDGREFPIFLLVVSLISVNIIAPVIAMFNIGFSLASWLSVLKVLPIIWVFVVVFVILTSKPAKLISNRILSPSDSFESSIAINILVNVFLMSICMTIVGSWIGSGGISWLPIQQFFYIWPRNFSIALFVELLLAHPIAHFIMHNYHL